MEMIFSHISRISVFNQPMDDFKCYQLDFHTNVITYRHERISIVFVRPWVVDCCFFMFRTPELYAFRVIFVYFCESISNCMKLNGNPEFSSFQMKYYRNRSPNSSFLCVYTFPPVLCVQFASGGSQVGIGDDFFGKVHTCEILNFGIYIKGRP